MLSRFSLTENIRIEEMRRNGMTWKGIADAMGVGKTTILRHVGEDAHFLILKESEPELFAPSRRNQYSEDGALERIASMMRAKKTYREIGREFGVGPDAIQKIIRRRGLHELAGVEKISTPRVKWSREEIARVKSYLDEGYSYRQVAQMTGHSDKSVAHYIPGYSKNGRLALSVKMYEYHMNKKIDEAWGFAA